MVSEDEGVDGEKKNQSLPAHLLSRALWARYERLLDEYPLLGRSLTAAAIAGASDVTVQVLSSVLSSSSSPSSRRQRATPTTSRAASPSSTSFQARRVALW